MIEIKNLKKHYGNIKALRGVSFYLEEGESVSVMGKSGCGKSTLLNCLSGILHPTDGEVIFEGKSLFDLKEKERTKMRLEHMGFIFQFFNLIPEFTVKENILLPLKFNKKEADEDYVNKLLKLLDISELVDRYPETLSGGQQQRVAIARALIHKPKVIFADEPTGNLDEESSDDVMHLLQELHDEIKMTLILVTHDKDIASYAKRHIIMRDGLIVSDSKINSI